MTDKTSLTQRLAPHWRGHLLRFENPLQPSYSVEAGTRLLLLFIVLEIVVGPRMATLGSPGVSGTPEWVRIPMMLTIALLAARVLAKVRFADLGLRPWSQWGPTERSYALQVLITANIVFALMFADQLSEVFGDAQLTNEALLAVPLLLGWGFYQELIYRGILQTELTRRLGTPRGILLANLVFTFGPLHFYHFALSSSPIGMFAAIFGIGMFFSILFQRSGNLWIVGIMHGIGNWYIDGLDSILS